MRSEYETIKSPTYTACAITEGLNAWAQAEGDRVVQAAVHLLVAAGIAQSWDGFGQYLAIELYTDPEDPDPTPYPVARVRDWSALHNALPVNEVGKSAFSLFVYARCLGDRGFVVCLSDLLEGMEPGTQRIVHDANAIRFGLPRGPWAKRGN